MNKRNLIAMTVGMVIFLLIVIISIVVFATDRGDSEAIEAIEDVAIAQVHKTTITTMDNDGLMIHNLTYYVQDERLHLDMWMGYPDPELLGGFSLYNLAKNDPPVYGSLIIAYTNA